MKVWRVVADILPGTGGVYSIPLCVVIQFSGECGKIPRFQVKRTIGERQQITGRLAHWFGNNFNASTALLITRLLKVALCSE